MESTSNTASTDTTKAFAKAVYYHQAGQFSDAKKVYERIVAIHPDHDEALHLLGSIAHQTGDHHNATTLISAAIRHNPENPIYYISLGDILKTRGQADQAMICYQKAIDTNPNDFEAYIKLGILHYNRENLDAALNYLKKAVQIKPNFAEIHYWIGLTYQAAQKLDHAIASYDKAIQLKPDYKEAHNNKGKALKDKQDLHEAAACFQRALQLDGDFAEPYFNLGDVSSALGQLETAVESYRHAIRCRPNMIEAYNNLGNVLKKQGDLDGAIENYKRVVGLKPDLAEAFCNLGSTQRLKASFDQAILHLRRALELKPDYAEAYNNLGLTYKSQGNLDQALENLSRALRIKPQFAEAHWNRGFTYLLNGNFKDGWHDYEWRFRQARWETLYPHRYGKSRWTGAPCPEKTIFIHDEQGLGDTLQFVRYISYVKPVCRKVIFETRKSLIPLLQGFRGIDQIVARSSSPYPDTNWDVYVPLLSLPQVFETRPDTIPDQIPYIHADSKKAAYWKQGLAGSGFKVGIVWAGRPQHTDDHNRSCRLEQFYPFSRIDGIQLIGLQKGAAAAQTRKMPAEVALTNYGEKFEDFSDTAAFIENLDLVISVDTAVAHLAGAMGKPVWVLLPVIPDWRWMMDRKDSPWYPTMRLFRQRTRGDWPAVFQQVEKELRRMVDPAINRV